MALDFPASPSVGQKFPASPIAGVPTYTWDGEKWVTSAPAVNGIYVAKVGDTMTGPLVLPGDPTAALQAAPKQYVDVGVAGALAANGIQINGAFDISQEIGTAGRTTPGYACDGWMHSFSGAMAVAAIGGPLNFIVGFGGLYYMTVQTAAPSLGASDYVTAVQRIEGYRTARLAWGGGDAKPITIAFWSTHAIPGIYSVTVKNADSTRCYAATYTHAAANVVQYNVITIPGDTTGTWKTDNDIGITVVFGIACGSTYTAPSANTWVAGNYLAAPGQINSVATTSQVFRMTGVVILPGIQTITAAQSPLLMRSYDQELQLCMRYYERFVIEALQAPAGSTMQIPYTYKAVKRANPTITFHIPATLTNASSAAFGSGNTQSGGFYVVATAAGGYAANWGITADARL